jgi:hypothetical protein
MIKFKLNGVKELSKDLNTKLEKDSSKFFNKELEILKITLVAATPIDTGYARSRWEYAEQTKFKISFKFSNKFLVGFTDKIYTVTNDTPYIIYLNKGSSKQAPSFFIEKTLISQGYKPIKL